MASHQPLIELFRQPAVNRFPALATAVSGLREMDLRGLFEQQMKTAPRRGLHKKYFVGHSGETTSGHDSNRREEHLAIALWRAYRIEGFPLPDGTALFPIEYQLPLKSHHNELNAGIGKVDLFCVEASGQPWICELKVHRAGENGTVETPLKALLEALAYCALVAADADALQRESLAEAARLGRAAVALRPNLLILATAEYWSACAGHEKRHPWKRPLLELACSLETALGIRTEFASMHDCAWVGPGPDKKPSLTGKPHFDWALPQSLKGMRI